LGKKYGNANCLGYVLNRNQFIQLGINEDDSETSGLDVINFYETSPENDLKIIKFLLKRYPQLRLISKEKILKKKGKTIIAFRYGNGDFHFIKKDKDSGKWYHKPGHAPVQEIEEDYVFNKDEWPLPFEGRGYNSRLFLFEMKE
jgi:hypothetical protein